MLACNSNLYVRPSSFHKIISCPTPFCGESKIRHCCMLYDIIIEISPNSINNQAKCPSCKYPVVAHFCSLISIFFDADISRISILNQTSRFIIMIKNRQTVHVRFKYNQHRKFLEIEIYDNSENR